MNYYPQIGEPGEGSGESGGSGGSCGFGTVLAAICIGLIILTCAATLLVSSGGG